jgi:hypothetical protein
MDTFLSPHWNMALFHIFILSLLQLRDNQMHRKLLAFTVNQVKYGDALHPWKSSRYDNELAITPKFTLIPREPFPMLGRNSSAQCGHAAGCLRRLAVLFCGGSPSLGRCSLQVRMLAAVSNPGQVCLDTGICALVVDPGHAV